MAGFAKLNEPQREALEMLAEEVAEVVQSVTKSLRHGLDSRHPNGGPTNLFNMKEELTGLLAVVGLLRGAGVDITPTDAEVHEAMTRKLQYAHHLGHGRS